MLPHPGPNSYADVLKRITHRMRQDQVDNQLLEIVVQAFEKELNRESAILSRPQRKRLLREVTEAMFNDMLGKMGEGKE